MQRNFKSDIESNNIAKAASKVKRYFADEDNNFNNEVAYFSDGHLNTIEEFVGILTWLETTQNDMSKLSIEPPKILNGRHFDSSGHAVRFSLTDILLHYDSESIYFRAALQSIARISEHIYTGDAINIMTCPGIFKPT